MQLAVAATVAVTVGVAELPDKTMIATVIMGSRSRPVLVWAGASAAFACQMALAVVAGRLLLLLPHHLTEALVTAVFLLGAGYLLLVDESGATSEGEEEGAALNTTSALRVVGSAFVVVALAEFGDLSQLLVANFTAKSHQPLAVYLGAVSALVAVAALGAFGGRVLLKVLPLERLRQGAGVVLAVLGSVSLYTLLS